MLSMRIMLPALILGLASGVTPVSAQLPRAAPERLPEVGRLHRDTIAYIYRAGWTDLRERLSGTPAGKVLGAEPARLFFDEVRRPAERGTPAARLFEFALDGLHEELVIAAREVSQSDNTTVSRHFAISRPAPNRRARFEALFQALKDSGAVASATETELSAEFVTVPGTKPVYLTWDDQRVVAADSAQAALWAVAPKAAEPLASSAVFRAAVDPLFQGQSGLPIALYYYDFRSWWPRLEAAPEARGWSESSWRSLDTVSGATFVEGGRFRNRHYWKIGPRRTGLFRHTQTSRINTEWLKRVPADATGLTTGVWDAAGFVPTLWAFIGPLFNPDPEMIRGAYAYADFLRPLASPLGPRYLVYRLPTRYNAGFIVNVLPNGSLVAMLELRRRGEFLKALDALGAPRGSSIGPAVTKSEWNGAEVRTITLFYVTFCIGVLDDVAFVAMNPQLLKDAIDFYRRPGASIVDTPAFREAQKHIVPDACFLMYFPPGGFARGIYDEFVPLLAQCISLAVASVGGNGGPSGDAVPGFNPLYFPRGRDLAGNLTLATVLSARDDGQGILFDGVAPLLTTSYYWAYVHALVNINTDGSTLGMWKMLAWVIGH